MDCATDLANKYGAELILLHVMASTGPARIPAELYEYARIEHIDAIEADIMKRVAEEILQTAENRARGQVRPIALHFLRRAEGAPIDPLLEAQKAREPCKHHVAARDGRSQSCGTKSARSSKKKFSVPRWARRFDLTDFAYDSGAKD
jgi:hypothetical protein